MLRLYTLFVSKGLKIKEQLTHLKKTQNGIHSNNHLYSRHQVFHICTTKMLFHEINLKQ